MEFVFARGSGQPQDTGETFLEFQKNMTLAARQAGLSFRITDLEYEAVAISAGNVLGTYVSAGEAYSFGRSVEDGVKELGYYARLRQSCANTYWVLAGYSQGAMVVANSLSSFDADKVAYVALFGDPKLYLPEGEGFNPPACRGEDLSEYRVFVPNCDTDNGILGARKPYELEGLAGRYGLWCGDNDFVCGSSKNPLNTKGHSQYEENGSVRTAAMHVLKRLKYLRKYREPFGVKRSALRLASEELSEDERLNTVLARLLQYRYYIDLGEELSFDASGSFSVDEGELEYAWYLGNQALGASGEVLKYRFDSAGIYTIGVEVSDGTGAIDRTDATVVVGMARPAKPTFALPNIQAERCGEKRICLSWTRTRSSAQYLSLRVNDSFLGFVDIANESLVIDDVDFSDIEVAMGYVDGGYNLGEMADLKIEGITELVPTAATLPWWRILAIAMLPLGILLLVRAILRLVRDWLSLK